MVQAFFRPQDRAVPMRLDPCERLRQAVRVPSRSVAVLAALSGLLGAGLPAQAADRAGSAFVQDNPATPHALPLSFDIPGMSLADALQHYGRVTGRAVLHDAREIAGLRSAAVSGVFTPDEALRRMTEGTGMVARFVSEQAFALVRAPRPERQVSANDPRQRYLGWMQSRVMQALCGDPLTRPGTYRMVLRFQLDEAHAITQLDLYEDNRDAALAQRVRQRLDGLPMGARPPAGLPQPFMLLVQRSQDGLQGCPL